MQPFDYQKMMEIHGTIIPLAILMIENDEDRDFMTDVYVQYKPLMYKTAKRYFSNNTTEIEDVISNAVLSMCRYCERIRSVPANRLSSYIICIIRNACNAQLKQIYAAKSRIAYFADPIELEQIVDEDALHEIILSRHNAIEILNSFRELNDRDRELIRMRHIDMMEYDEIAETFDISLVAARTAVFRAKQRLEKLASSLNKEEKQ